MKKIYFQVSEEILPQVYLCYNAFNNRFILMNKSKYEIYEKMDLSKIEKDDPSFYELLMENKYIVSDDFDEFEVATWQKKKMQYDSSMYEIMVNTTLDCNLNCWYCYENKIYGSFLSDDVIEAIKKNMEYEYFHTPYRLLKISFFGGEPFLYYKGIQDILNFAKVFCQSNGLELIAEFTTNATLIDSSIVDYLKDFKCNFQITFDGDRDRHNQIKKDMNNSNSNTYDKTLNALRMIDENITNRRLAVRINFDNKTLEKIDRIINDLDFLNRKYCFVILKKVWQLTKEKVNESLLHEAVQKLLDKKFLVDYYIMPKGDVCFAERHREVLFNYDGKVFKCSTIPKFDDQYSLGEFDLASGKVSWNETQIAYWFKEMLPSNCLKCQLLPACMGPCNKQIMLHPGENICTFDAINMTRKEYLMYLFKCQLLQEELNK
mgnify:CR=1 FL=1